MRPIDRHSLGLLAFFCCAWIASNRIFGYATLLQSESADSFFMFGNQYLREWLGRPGDLTIYASRFLRQFSHFGWLGTLIVSALASGLGLLAHLIARRLRPEPSILHTLLPAVALLTLHINGTDVTVGVLTQYSALLGYLSLRSGAGRRLYAAAVTILLYFLTGAYVWAFVLWVLVYESRGRPASSSLGYRVVYLALAVCLPLVAYRWLYSISLAVAFRHPVYPSGSVLYPALCAYLAFLPLGLGLPWSVGRSSLLARRYGLAVQIGLVAFLAAVLLGLAYDSDSAEVARYHRLYKSRQWDAILEAAASEPSSSGMVQFFTNYALSKKGLLLDEMFRYPQMWGPNGLILSSSTEEEDLRRAMYASDLLFEIGHVNAALRLAHNQLNMGKSYANLRRLAECNIANGSYEIAAKYLRLLERTLFHRDFARHHLALLSDPAVADTCLAAVRGLRPQFELRLDLGYFAGLLSLVETNPRNRMAFDYLTAWCLLDKNALPMMNIALPRLEQAGYASPPTHVQEGLLLWRQLAGTAIGAEELGIEPAVQRRFADFGRQVRHYADRESAQLGLREAFGDTYMYYYAVVNEVVKQGEPHTKPLTWIGLGNEYNAVGRVDEAIAFYRQAVRTPPRYGAAHLSLASALLAQGKSAEADSHFQQVLQFDPVTRQVHVRLEAWHLGSH